MAGQRREYLSTLTSFERGGDLMLIEAKSCSEAASMRTTVVLQGDEYVVRYLSPITSVGIRYYPCKGPAVTSPLKVDIASAS